MSCVSQVSLSSKLQQVLHMFLFIDKVASLRSFLEKTSLRNFFEKKSEQMNEKNKWNEGSLASVECVFFFCRSDKGVVFFYYLRKEGGLGFLDP